MGVMTELRQRSTELTDLNNILALMQWDQEVQMPAAAGAERASQFAALSTVIHRQEVDPTLGELLQAARALAGLTDADQALVRVMQRNYDQNTKLPEKFVAELARLTSQALPVWIEARQAADFKRFAPHLARLVEMARQKATYLGFANEPYDALLDLHEEGLLTSEVERIFSELQEPLVAMLAEARSGRAPAWQLPADLELAAQIKFAEQVLAKIGYDFTRGRQDLSTHPFTTSLGHNDRRLTNRYQPRSLEFIFSALHEGGHGLYEQGIAAELAHSHLDTGVSLGIHESQSRLWENIIGRSRPFWENFYPALQQAFPAFKALAVTDFLAVINRVQPGPIRVEADEVSYNLHILIRFELERGLLAGRLEVGDLPDFWNDKYRRYLGVVVDSPAQGVLQDIHWAHGSFGYFPTYTIGNLAAAQFWQAYCRFDPDHEQTVRAGELHKIRAWLTDHIYRHGAVLPPALLIERVTGQKLTGRYFMDYLQNKYAGLVQNPAAGRRQN